MQKERASKKQQELLSFVDGFIKGNGYGPSYREVMRALGYKSVSTVAVHIDNLIAKGYLIRRDNSARSLEVVGSRNVSAEDDSTRTLEVELKKRLIGNFTPEDKLHIKRALELLGFSTLAESVKTDEEEA